MDDLGIRSCNLTHSKQVPVFDVAAQFIPANRLRSGVGLQDLTRNFATLRSQCTYEMYALIVIRLPTPEAMSRTDLPFGSIDSAPVLERCLSPT